MSLFKYVERLKVIHKLIEMEKTGTSDQFAARLNISRSLLMDHLKEMREAFNAPILYCRKRGTFYYSDDFKFTIQITSSTSKMIKGGRLETIFAQSTGAGLYSTSFESHRLV